LIIIVINVNGYLYIYYITLLTSNFKEESKIKKLKKTFCALLVILVLFSGFTFAAPKVHYHATINDDSDFIHVKVKIENINSETHKLVFYLPDLPSYSKDAEQFNFHDFMSDLKAYSDSQDLDIKSNEEYIEIDYDPDVTYFEYSVEKQIYNIDPFLSDQLIPVVYCTDDYGYFWSAFLFLSPGWIEEPSSLHITLDTPEGWEVMAPFKKIDNHYAVEESDVISLYRHLMDSGFYMGEIDFIAEKEVDGTIHRIAQLKANEDEWAMTTYEEAEAYIEKVTKVYNYFVDLFGHNPYPVDLWIPVIKEFKDGTQISPGFGFMGNGWHWWPDDREFEITCHVVQSFMRGAPSRPLMTNTGITKGFGEYYLGFLSSYEIFKKDIDLAKMYYTYLVYERLHEGQSQNHFEYEFMKGFALGIYLDNKIQEMSYDNYSLKDIIKKVYDKYHLTDHTINYEDIQEAIFRLTGDRMESEFNDYVYGDKKIPAYQYVSDYERHFKQLPDILDETFGTINNDYIIPLFINIEMTVQNNQHIMSGLSFPNFTNEFADYTKENYSIDDLTKSDVEDILTELTGRDSSGFFSNWEETYGILEIEELKAWLNTY